MSDALRSLVTSHRPTAEIRAKAVEEVVRVTEDADG